ncbi:MAG TPA: discoidin domain-containing protein, partial [Pyrinomonadaceae bacterium]|nr:discoidin domain-containing protein [Pyrinomonadaceae bacterium]
DTVPVFWNRLMGPAWGRMLGLWADTKHPALSEFPTEANFDWQWADIVTARRALNMDRLPRELQAIVWAIDDWNRNYKLGVIFECKVGRGRLLVSSFDFVNTQDTSPVARQLRRSILDYMASDKFQPIVSVTVEQIRSLLFDTRIMRKLGAVASGEGNAASAIDGDPNTFWQAGAPQGRGSKHPHDLTIAFNAPVAMNGLVLMPRQNHREHEGDIREYVIEVSDDGETWREVVHGSLVSTFDPQQIKFPQTVTARYLRLTALSGFGSDTTAALAELAVIYAGPKLKETDDGTIEYQRNRSASPDIDEGTVAPKKPATSPQKPNPKPKSEKLRRL